MLLHSDVIAILLATVHLLPRHGVGISIKCECSLPIFGRFCLACVDQLGRDGRSGGDLGRGGVLPEVEDPQGETSA
jgi:hypothetical protein